MDIATCVNDEDEILIVRPVIHTLNYTRTKFVTSVLSRGKAI